VAHNLLERYRDARLRVYVVWVHRWATDTRSEIDGAGLLDRRVTQFWDTGGVIGAPFLERFGVDLGGLDYDFFLLFGPEATWGSSPPRPVSSGGTVITSSDRLARAAAGLLG
jgi:hypothetical protein